MRILYYVYGWPPERVHNGIVSAISVLAPALRRLGHEASVLAATGENTSEADDVVILGDPAPQMREWAPLRAIKNRVSPHRHQFETPALKIASALSTRDLDIFEIEESFGWSAAIAKRVSPLVVTRLHGPWFMSGAALKGVDAFDEIDRLRIKREGEAISAAAAVTAPSRYVLDRVRSYYGLELPRARVIPNAVLPPADHQVWSPGEADADELLFVGRFDRLKGADTVLRAFAKLAAGRPRLKLTFVGPNAGAIEEAGRKRDRFQFLAEELPADIASRVSFLGPLPHPEIAPLRRRAFLTLIGSLDETFSLTFLEAAAAGSPIVATGVGGIPEIGRHGVEAMLIPPADPAAMADSIARLLDNPSAAAEFGERARRRAIEAYTPDRVAAMSIDSHTEFLERRGRRAPN